MRDNVNWEPDEMGKLRVECWCAESLVFVDPQKLKDGQTERCGRPGCSDGHEFRKTRTIKPLPTGSDSGSGGSVTNTKKNQPGPGDDFPRIQPGFKKGYTRRQRGNLR